MQRVKLIVLYILLCVSTGSHADGPPVVGIATANPLATKAGEQILQQGGNAFDAAVAITAALAVVEPSGSGLGGGGFWLLHRESDGKQVMIDGRETAPAFAHRRMYLDERDQVRERLSLDGPLAGGIPGIPAGMVYLAVNYGRLPLAESMAPAIALAELGHGISQDLHQHIQNNLELLRRYPSSAKVFLQQSEALPAGHVLIQEDLARTLRSIAEYGVSGFYQGEIARKLVQGVQEYGGIWTLQDLERYVVLERRPVEFTYKGIKVVSASLPSSGGIVLGQVLQMLEHFNLSALDRVARAHLIIEALRRAYRDRAAFLGDPDFDQVPIDRLLDRDYLEGLAIMIDPSRATPSDELGDTPGTEEGGSSTTHFSVIDREGNRVAASLSINRFMGSGFVIPGTGVLLNDEMDDFVTNPLIPGPLGPSETRANEIVPGKRPLSSMSPTFVESSERIGILGTPGGTRIISMVLLGILDFADGQLPESWVDLPRFHHQYKPDVVVFEPKAFTEQERQELMERGHTLRVSNRQYGNMQAVMWDKRTDHVYAVSDKRGEGHAVVLYPVKQNTSVGRNGNSRTPVGLSPLPE
jgi:gamma-glutamyltranspeptidase/glutathione hydrolase